MTPQQSRMARAALKWSLTDLAQNAGVGRATAARFELGEAVDQGKVDEMRRAFEAKRIQFIDKGRLAGAVYCGMRKAP